MGKTPEQMIALVKNAGVVGAAGTGFPTHLKLQNSVDTVIINASECEPLIYTDQFLLLHQSDNVVEGLRLALLTMKAHDGIIAINRRFKDAIKRIEKSLLPYPNLRLHLLDDYYPAGDEFLLVYDVTQKNIPENGSPLSVGIAVFNVSTAIQIYQAVNGKVATERMITVTGEVKEPKVFSVPIGTSYLDLIDLAGGSKLKDFSVLSGGPMMGSVVSQLDQGISKSTRGIVVLPTHHWVIQMKTKTLSETLKSSKAASGQNTQTTDFCPRHLLGHSIEPHEALIAADYQQAEPSTAVSAALLCSGCGICELVSNDSLVSPKKVYDEFKRILISAKVKNPHTRSQFPVHSQFENRKIPTPLLLKKLNLTSYDQKPQYSLASKISRVRIPLNTYWGLPSETCVEVGQIVKRGEVIATPTSNEGILHHASIPGTISHITEDFIEITGLPA